MNHIAIISSSVRIGRNSHRLALYFEKYIRDNNLATVEMLDLHQYNFPLFDERLQYMKNPSPVPKVHEAHGEDGTPSDKAGTDKRAARFLEELLWCVEASARMKQRS